MKTQEGQPIIALHQAATITGIAIVIMTMAAVVATDLSIERLMAPENPEATFVMIKTHPILFRIGIFSWLVVLVCDLVIAWGLYILFRSVHRNISLMIAWIRLVYTAILGTSISNLIQLHLLLKPNVVLKSIPSQSLIFEASLSLEAFYAVWSMGLIVFGLHILLLGFLCQKSTYIPKWMGILLMIGGIGYMILHSIELLAPSAQSLIQILTWIFILPMLSEVALGLWLLVRGKKFESMNSR